MPSESYNRDYRNFTGVKTERQPVLSSLRFFIDVDEAGVVRTKRAALANGNGSFEDYRYYTAEQAEKIGLEMIEAADRARRKLRPTERQWERVAGLVHNGGVAARVLVERSPTTC